jgi:hypothetical protein
MKTLEKIIIIKNNGLQPCVSVTHTTPYTSCCDELNESDIEDDIQDRKITSI